MQNTKSGFKPEISFLNVLLCILVILIHLFTGEMLKNSIIAHIQKMMFFAIFGFVFLSALKLFMQKEKPWAEYIKSCFKKIILPYIFAAVMYYIILTKIGYLSADLKQLPYLVVSGRLSAQFYFVPMIVQFYILMPIIRMLTNKLPGGYVIWGAFAINVLTVIIFYKYSFFNRLCGRYVFCYILGVYAGLNYNAFLKLLKNNTFKILIIYIFLQLIDFYVETPLAHQLITILYMPSAIIFYYMVSLYITEKFKIISGKIFGVFNSVTYQVYLWHVLAIILAENISSVFNINRFAYIIRLSAVVLCTFLLILIKKACNHLKS